jgi:hypothetical protein
MYACNSSTQEAEAGGLWVWGQYGLPRDLEMNKQYSFHHACQNLVLCPHLAAGSYVPDNPSSSAPYLDLLGFIICRKKWHI